MTRDVNRPKRCARRCSQISRRTSSRRKCTNQAKVPAAPSDGRKAERRGRTMHRLHLLRHAKATRDSGYEDQDRPLARRGRTDARLVGEKLTKLLESVDLVLCSSSV